MAVAPRLTVTGTKALQNALIRGAAQTPGLVAAVVAKVAGDLAARTQRNASGRPGPRVITGDYRQSWSVQDAGSDHTQVALSVGTDRVQANRLEYGFVGVDSLGRVYDQPPFPHHGPAVEVAERQLDRAMDAVARKATGW